MLNDEIENKNKKYQIKKMRIKFNIKTQGA
jgi:hypothetical protein